MSRPSSPAHPSFALDALRAAAAVLVLLSHARDMLVCDVAAAPAVSLPARLFMAMSGLGHQAVVVFFVLSGYLVTAAMLRLAAAGRWSLPVFAVSRLTRLWIVLGPSLVLGGCLDVIGLAVRGDAAAALPYGIPPLGPTLGTPALGAAVAIANLFFLQTIAAPVFGSNGALWSLANEAWYYALAGLAFAAWRSRRTPAAAAAPLLVAAVIICLLPTAILQLAPIWAFGAAVAMMPAPTGCQARRAMPTAIAFAALLVTSRLRIGPSPLALDLLLGAAAALLLRHLVAAASPRPGPAKAAVHGISSVSYSLYLSHCPVLALFSVLAVGGVRRQVGPDAYALVGVGMGVALLVAWLVWWGFERHTDRCRRGILGLLAVRPAADGLEPSVQGSRP